MNRNTVVSAIAGAAGAGAVLAAYKLLWPRREKILGPIRYRTTEKPCETCGGKGELTAHNPDLGEMTYSCRDCEDGTVKIRERRF